MITRSQLIAVVKNSYLVLILALLGVLAFIFAMLIAWPAVVYLAARLVN